METRVDLSKNVRIHEALAEVFNKIQLKELSYEVMFFLFAKLSKSHEDETEYVLDMKQFQTLTGRQANLQEYKNAVRELRGLTLEIETDEYELIDGVLSSAKFMKGAGSMRVKISSDMKPYLLNLVNNYTAPQLFSMLRLNSKHAKKLYLYFYPKRPKKGLIRTVLEETSITQFKVDTGYIDSEGKEFYKQWIHFKTRVLEVAKDEINAVSDIKVAYYPRKLGRGYYFIEWHIENKNNEEMIQLEEFDQNKAIEANFDEKMKELDLTARLNLCGLSSWQINKLLKKVDHEHLKNTFLSKTIKGETLEKYVQAIQETKRGKYTVKAVIDQYDIDLNTK